MSNTLQLKALTGYSYKQLLLPENKNKVIAVESPDTLPTAIDSITIKLTNRNNNIKFDGTLNILTSLTNVYFDEGSTIVLTLYIYSNNSPSPILTQSETLFYSIGKILSSSTETFSISRNIPFSIVDKPILPMDSFCPTYYFRADYTITDVYIASEGSIVIETPQYFIEAIEL